MENLIVNSVDLVIKIYFFGQIYLFWINRLRPTLQEQYSFAKGNRKVQVPGPNWWQGIYKETQICFYTVKSLLPALFSYIYTSLRTSAFLHRNFPQVMRRIPNWKSVEQNRENVTSVLVEGKSKRKEDYSKRIREHSN